MQFYDTFSASREQFVTWEEAIDYLNRQAVVSRRALGKEIPESIASADIIETAPENVLTEFLERVENELIPKKMFDPARIFCSVCWQAVFWAVTQPLVIEQQSFSSSARRPANTRKPRPQS